MAWCGRHSRAEMGSDPASQAPGTSLPEDKGGKTRTTTCKPNRHTPSRPYPTQEPQGPYSPTQISQGFLYPSTRIPPKDRHPRNPPRDPPPPKIRGIRVGFGYLLLQPPTQLCTPLSVSAIFLKPILIFRLFESRLEIIFFFFDCFSAFP